MQFAAGEEPITGTIASPDASISLPHTYTTQGTHTGWLIVEDEVGGHKVERPVSVSVTAPPNKKPTATLSVDPADGREDLEVTASFTASDSDSGPDPLEWVVDWGDGSCTPRCAGGKPTWSAVTGRSEEKTSELQSLMRISYAGFCLKKKKK